MKRVTRESYGVIITELGDKNKDIIVLDADLSKVTKSEIFKKKHSDRFFDVGIAEQNMLGMASGLAILGKIPLLSILLFFKLKEI